MQRRRFPSHSISSLRAPPGAPCSRPPAPPPTWASPSSSAPPLMQCPLSNRCGVALDGPKQKKPCWHEMYAVDLDSSGNALKSPGKLPKHNLQIARQPRRAGKRSSGECAPGSLARRPVRSQQATRRRTRTRKRQGVRLFWPTAPLNFRLRGGQPSTGQPAAGGQPAAAACNGGHGRGGHCGAQARRRCPWRQGDADGERPSLMRHSLCRLWELDVDCCPCFPPSSILATSFPQ